MARIDITGQVARILTTGGTEAQITATHPRITRLAGDWYADNRAARDAVDALEAKLATANDMLAKIRSGQILYTKDATGQWLIWGREDLIVSGATVTTTRANGTTSQATITTVGPAHDRDGLRYCVAEFTTPRRLDTDPGAEALRIGRSHGVNGQVWDNA